MEGLQGSSQGSKAASPPEQTFMASFAHAFTFEPTEEEGAEPAKGGGAGAKGGKSRKREAEEVDEGGGWSKSKGRKKVAKIESDVRKVVERLVTKLEASAEAEVRKQLQMERRERKHQEKLDERQKKADERAAAKAAREKEKKVKKNHKNNHGPNASRGNSHASRGSIPEKYVEDSILSGAGKWPPPPKPVGSGVIPDEHITGLVEVWAFLNRFGQPLGLKSVVGINEIEQWLADVGSGPEQSKALPDLHAHLVNILLQEAFQAARDSMRVPGGNDGKKGSSLGCPKVDGQSWQEGLRRYLFAMETAHSAASYFSKISSSGLAQRLDVPCALSTLSPRVCISILCGGVNSAMLSCSPLLLVPGRNTKAFNCLLNRNDAEGMATLERWLDGRSPTCANKEMTEEEVQLQSELRRALRPIIHAKDSRSGAPGEIICYHGSSSAPSAMSPVQWDLHRVASLVQAGAYVGEDAWKLLLMDVRSSCEVLETAIANGGVGLVRDLRNLGSKAGRAVKRVADRLENNGLRESDGKIRDSDIERPFMPFEGCCICWKDEDKPRILLCDNCDDEYHLYCLDPPLEEIPEGDWFCPVCVKQLGQNVVGNALHSDTMTEKGDDGKLADMLGCQSQESMSPVDRLSILMKICECSLGTNKFRSHLEESIEAHKELRKEVAGLQGKKAQSDKRVAGGANNVHQKNVGDNITDARSTESKIRELNHSIASCVLRPQRLGWDRHYNCYWTFGGTQQAAVFVEKSTCSFWMEATQQKAAPHGKSAPKNANKSKRDQSKVPISSHHQSSRSSSRGHSDNPQQNGAHLEQSGPKCMPSRGKPGGEVRKWSAYEDREELQKVIDFLNPRGIREGPLRQALEQFCKQLEIREVSQEASENGIVDAEGNKVPQHSSPGSGVPSDEMDVDGPSNSGSGCSEHVENIEDEALQVRRELLDLMDNLPDESFDPVRGSCVRRAKWKACIREASKPQELMSALLCLFTMFHPSALQPHWWMWSFPTQNAARVASMPAVFYYLTAAKAALKVRVKVKGKARIQALGRGSSLHFAPQVGVRRSNRVAQLAANPTDWRPNPEAAVSEYDSDEGMVIDIPPSPKDVGTSEEEVVEDSEEEEEEEEEDGEEEEDDDDDDEEWVMTEEVDEVPQRSAK